MKDRLSILIFSTLLLMAVSYGQVFQKLMADNVFSIELVNDDAEENKQKTSEENSRESDLDEDPFSINDAVIVSLNRSHFNLKNSNYSFGQFGYYPEIVSPPPQA